MGHYAQRAKKRKLETEESFVTLHKDLQLDGNNRIWSLVGHIVEPFNYVMDMVLMNAQVS